MSKLLNDLSTGKIAHQNYVVEHGIERLQIAIPLQHVKSFEEAFNAAGDSKAKILEAVSAVGGKVK